MAIPEKDFKIPKYFPIYSTFETFKANILKDRTEIPNYIYKCAKIYAIFLEDMEGIGGPETPEQSERSNKLREIMKGGTIRENIHLDFGEAIQQYYLILEYCGDFAEAETSPHLSEVFHTATNKPRSKELTGTKKIKILLEAKIDVYLQGKGFSNGQTQKFIADIVGVSEELVRKEVPSSTNKQFADEYLSNLKSYSRS